MWAVRPRCPLVLVLVCVCARRQGGAFEYAADSRVTVEAWDTWPPDEELGPALGAQAPPLRSGTLYLFRGPNPLWRPNPLWP